MFCNRMLPVNLYLTILLYVLTLIFILHSLKMANKKKHFQFFFIGITEMLSVIDEWDGASASSTREKIYTLVFGKDFFFFLKITSYESSRLQLYIDSQCSIYIKTLLDRVAYLLEFLNWAACIKL